MSVNFTPIVSVLTTAYNREKYIAEAIESVLSSTFEDFELIIVDDCSMDNTVEIARKYEVLDSRVKVYVNESNLGDYPNRNKAASYAIGKYIKYLDSDDTMSLVCLERMVSEMDRNPDCAFCISSRFLFEVYIHYPKDSYRIHFFERGILDVGPSSTIIRNDIFKKENGFLETRCVSDFEFWLRLALAYPMLEIEKDLIYWREHDQQEIRLNSLIYLEHTITIIKEKLYLSQLSDIEKHTVIQIYKKNTMRYLLKNIFKMGIIKMLKYKRLNNLKFSDVI
jgi:glycosyltransferase involved in cell wall biosynthesis